MTPAIQPPVNKVDVTMSGRAVAVDMTFPRCSEYELSRSCREGGFDDVETIRLSADIDVTAIKGNRNTCVAVDLSVTGYRLNLLGLRNKLVVIDMGGGVIRAVGIAGDENSVKGSRLIVRGVVVDLMANSGVEVLFHNGRIEVCGVSGNRNKVQLSELKVVGVSIAAHIGQSPPPTPSGNRGILRQRTASFVEECGESMPVEVAVI
ncbi:hypothetical protein [Streptomyces syringium]|uniref:hypothetical protein n=1 Tax=Streptomyces syringium TaxID=76729 RepID=UPI0034531CC2